MLRDSNKILPAQTDAAFRARSIIGEPGKGRSLDLVASKVKGHLTLVVPRPFQAGAVPPITRNGRGPISRFPMGGGEKGRRSSPPSPTTAHFGLYPSLPTFSGDHRSLSMSISSPIRPVVS